MNAVSVTEKQILPRPPVKWAGGKSQLLEQFELLFPRTEYSLYLEPFVGGGAVFFHLQPEKAVLIDSSEELINFYLTVRNHLEELLIDLRKHENKAEYYYRIRALNPEELSPVGRASRFLYLNKTGYNGLWRVNRQGKHNVPFGRYKNPKIVDEPNLRLVSEALKRAEIICGDFSLALDHAKAGAIVYLDPPYHPVSATASFTSYTAENFGEEEQKRLAEVFRELDRKGCLVMLSNSDTEFVRGLYSGYNITTVHAKRAINCRADRRGPVKELVIRNYS
ncbi:MAG: DNA adenine methylase [Syntrophothermus sp.]|uniref:DNA adenine methylase n=1 Tax=Syntrophothermus sp. TaxID=2736299 RepID=UPI0025796F82|nr:DNA adenine methylase [Syntrophothermus sp.]NSW84268.1 DNA adenine methylase [Syntrophothermus sp.]